MEGLLEYHVQNKDSTKKLQQIEDEITDAVRVGRQIVVRNESDYAIAATTVVENVKNRLRSSGLKVYQANKLEYEPVLVAENPDEPLAKRKTHHYKIYLTMQLSREPIPKADDVTLQETAPTAKGKRSS